MNDRSPADRRLSLLGGFALHQGGEPVEVSGAGQRVLAYLAVRCRHHPVRRCSVAEELWSDVPAQQASSSLRSVLWRLPRPRGRRLVIVTSASDLVLADDLVVDLWEVGRAATRLASGAEPEVAVEAAVHELTSLRAELLPGWDEQWLLVEREAYRQTRLHYLEQLAARLRRVGQFGSSLHAALAAAAFDPLRESAHRSVVETHLCEGNASEALRHYYLYRELLAAELGLSPSPAMRRLVAPLQGRPVEREVPA